MRKMRKVVITLMIMMAVIIPCFDSGAMTSVCSTNTVTASIGLVFSSTSSGSVGTAICSANIAGKVGTNKIKGTMKLYKITSQSEIFIRSWDISSTNRYLDVTETCSVSHGKYKLIYTVKVYKNGTSETINRNITRTYS